MQRVFITFVVTLTALVASAELLHAVPVVSREVLLVEPVLGHEILERDHVLVDLRGAAAKSDFALMSLRFIDNMRPLPRSGSEDL